MDRGRSEGGRWVTAPIEWPLDCDFCSIARGEDPSAEVVCEGESWVAFFPLHPATLGHTLVIPRNHVVDLWKVKPPLGEHLMTAAIDVGRGIQAALAPEGMNLITSAGQIAEQTVFHLHLHLVPRWTGDGFGEIWSPAGLNDDLALKGAAAKIRETCIHGA
jgi:histidine triad (HIT) family protein